MKRACWRCNCKRKRKYERVERRLRRKISKAGGGKRWSGGEMWRIIIFVRCDLFWCEILNKRWEDTDKVGCPQRELRKRTRQMTLRKYIVLWNVTCNTARLPTWFTCKFYPDHLEHFPLVHLHLESGPPTLLEASEPPGLWLSWPAWLWWWLTTSDGLLQHFLLGSSRQLKILRGVLAFQCKLLFMIINMNITITTTIAMVIMIDFDDRRKSWVARNGPCWPTSPRRARTNIGIQRWMICWFVSKTFIKNVWPLGKLHYTTPLHLHGVFWWQTVLRLEMPDNFAIMIMIIIIIIIMIRLWPVCLRWWCLFAWLALEISSLFFRLFSTGYNAYLHRFTEV